jgi:hypothetical protein
LRPPAPNICHRDVFFNRHYATFQNDAIWKFFAHHLEANLALNVPDATFLQHLPTSNYLQDFIFLQGKRGFYRGAPEIDEHFLFTSGHFFMHIAQLHVTVSTRSSTKRLRL